MALKLLLFFVLTSFTRNIFIRAESPPACEVTHSNICFWRKSSGSTSNRYAQRDDASEYCEGFGGHLASLNTADIETAVTTGISQLGDEEYWIGCKYDDGNDVWVWDSGVALSYTNFRTSHSGNKDCCLLKASHSGEFKWNPQRCNSWKRVLCQRGELVPAQGASQQAMKFMTKSYRRSYNINTL